MAWAAPTSVVGLLAAAALALRGGRAQWREGVLEVAPRRALTWPCGAITLGHVVLASSHGQLEATRAHERVHVAQAERWGPAFIPAYLLASAWMALTGRRAYRDNPFEVQARRLGG